MAIGKEDDADADAVVIKYGIIGVGMMGREHLINLHHLRNQGVAVVCVADPHVPSQQQASNLAESFDWSLQVPNRIPAFKIPAFSSFGDVVGSQPHTKMCCICPKIKDEAEMLTAHQSWKKLGSSKPRILAPPGHKQMLDSGICDVVVVSSPNMTHFEILMDIISHPRPHHVLVEKPLCTTVSHCKKVVDAAKKRPEILVQVGLEYRYMPPVAKLIDIVKGGTLGQVRMVAIREHRFPFLVKVNNWNRFNCNTGGTLVEKCCHFFDLMRLFAGSNPVRVMASGAMDVNHKDEMYDGKVPDIIDNAYVIVEFENGSRGVLDLCMFAEGSNNEQEISVAGDIGKGEAFVPESIVRWGTRTEGRNGPKTLRAVDDRIKYDGLHHGSSYLEHLNFLSAIRAKGVKVPAVDLHDGLVSVAIGVAAQLSIEKGRFVTIKEVMIE